METERISASEIKVGDRVMIKTYVAEIVDIVDVTERSYRFVIKFSHQESTHRLAWPKFATIKRVIK